MFFTYYFVLAITSKGLQITVTHLNIIDTVRFSQCVNYFLEIEPTFWKLDDRSQPCSIYSWNNPEMPNSAAE